MSAPDVLVVGGGPAGSTVAGLLADHGLAVELVDKARFPRPKPCGECLNPGAVAALARLGLLDAVMALHPAPLDGWCVRGARAEASADFGGGLGGLGVPRSELDLALLERARARGVRVRTGVRVEDVHPAHEGERPSVALREERGVRGRVRPRVVVGADGLRSRVASALGLVARRPRPAKVSFTGRLRWPGAPARTRGLLRVRDGMTLGLAPVHATEPLWNATLVVAPPAARRGRSGPPARLLTDAVHDAFPDLDPPALLAGPWASGPFDRPVSAAWAPGIVLVGDAAGYYDPFTGQGIFRALRSAELAAPAVARALDAGSWAPLRDFDHRWRREVAPKRRVQRAVDIVMSRTWLRERVLSGLERTNALAPIIRVTGDVAPVTSLLRPW